MSNNRPNDKCDGDNVKVNLSYYKSQQNRNQSGEITFTIPSQETNLVEEGILAGQRIASKQMLKERQINE